jgi:NADP-dependent 3-hydroxy acid dehydrogenase YdfG
MIRAFKDQTALVTGASSGIGRAIALGLAAEGATLCLVGRRAGPLAAVAELAGATAPRVVSYHADLDRDRDLEELATSVARDCGTVDVLVHAAGIYAPGPVAAGGVAALDGQYRTNVRAPFALTGALLPLLRPDRGQVVFVNSTAGRRAAAGVGAYAATKHAVRALADALREEVNGRGVRVLSVFVGRTATPMQEAIHRAEGRPYRAERLLQPEDVAGVVLHALALPRTAEVTELTIRPLQKPSAAA